MTKPMEKLPLPEHPVLEAWASALNDAGYWAFVVDAQWRYVFQTDELRLTFEDMRNGAAGFAAYNEHVFSAQAFNYFGAVIGQYRDSMLDWLGPYVLASTPGGRDELRRLIHPEIAHRVDELEPKEVPPIWLLRPEWTTAGADTSGMAVWFRLDDEEGEIAGFVSLS